MFTHIICMYICGENSALYFRSCVDVARMKFNQVLRQKLRKEFEAGQASIARDKADVMEGNKTSLMAMKLKLKREGELKERIAAFAVFNRNVTRARRLGGKLKVLLLVVWFGSWGRGRGGDNVEIILHFLR